MNDELEKDLSEGLADGSLERCTLKEMREGVIYNAIYKPDLDWSNTDTIRSEMAGAGRYCSLADAQIIASEIPALMARMREKCKDVANGISIGLFGRKLGHKALAKTERGIVYLVAIQAGVMEKDDVDQVLFEDDGKIRRNVFN